MNDPKQINPFNMDKEVWKQLKIQAIIENKRTGKLVEEAIKFYLENKAKDMATKINWKIWSFLSQIFYFFLYLIYMGTAIRMKKQ